MLEKAAAAGAEYMLTSNLTNLPSTRIKNLWAVEKMTDLGFEYGRGNCGVHAAAVGTLLYNRVRTRPLKRPSWGYVRTQRPSGNRPISSAESLSTAQTLRNRISFGCRGPPGTMFEPQPRRSTGSLTRAPDRAQLQTPLVRANPSGSAQRRTARREWDSNPRDPQGAHWFSRPAPSSTRPSLRGAVSHVCPGGITRSTPDGPLLAPGSQGRRSDQDQDDHAAHRPEWQIPESQHRRQEGQPPCGGRDTGHNHHRGQQMDVADHPRRPPSCRSSVGRRPQPRPAATTVRADRHIHPSMV